MAARRLSVVDIVRGGYGTEAELEKRIVRYVGKRMKWAKG